METLATAELASQSDVEVEHPSSVEATPTKRVYKSRKHVQESTLSLQNKVNLRQKIRKGTPYGQEMPKNEKPIRKRALENLSCPKRFKHFLNQPHLPTCKRWDVNKKVPVDKINHLGFNI
ncbi:Hypothetical protein SRAE_0000068400 [Strongyloides ratti]|uniref:Uncharacterized protein n=1 Tax=Strongyloides ratti TaxID=34506 RepID=A0A090KVW9_STRRB|nr:Hypothetical protein SRAE_X000233900 [Strongyloides ratti]XP_024500775.1 Hypothetical protein SRAE_0000068400 [Strongyloides ratti]CEF60604.1 Hypothetical protein SRAE_X000233900 [Strongyloides ratti]CEF61566.1 Hypothetical protein SRAE_0000068400 [Strongyloides ratti]